MRSRPSWRGATPVTETSDPGEDEIDDLIAALDRASRELIAAGEDSAELWGSAHQASGASAEAAQEAAARTGAFYAPSEQSSPH